LIFIYRSNDDSNWYRYYWRT